jgi:hypothetical protein
VSLLLGSSSSVLFSANFDLLPPDNVFLKMGEGPDYCVFPDYERGGLNRFCVDVAGDVIIGHLDYLGCHEVAGLGVGDEARLA